MNRKSDWQARGRDLGPNNEPVDKPKDPDGPERIIIPEAKQSFDMSELKDPIPKPSADDKNPNGQPIEARLAVHLMHSFWKKCGDGRCVIQLKELDLWVKLRELISPIGREVLELFNQLEQQVEDRMDVAAKIIKITDGITFDKNIVLKILSQPNCEGLRCYMGLEKNELTLVLVGVDINGYDLYYFSDTTKAMIDSSKVNLPEVTTDSLVAEYGHKPPTGTSIGDQRYVLKQLSIQ